MGALDFFSLLAKEKITCNLLPIRESNIFEGSYEVILNVLICFERDRIEDLREVKRMSENTDLIRKTLDLFLGYGRNF